MKAYVIKDIRDGRISFDTLSKSRKRSILIFCNSDKWKMWYSIGYRCVPVEITEPIKIDPDGARLKITKIISQAMTDTMNTVSNESVDAETLNMILDSAVDKIFEIKK